MKVLVLFYKRPIHTCDRSRAFGSQTSYMCVIQRYYIIYILTYTRNYSNWSKFNAVMNAHRQLSQAIGKRANMPENNETQ